MDPLSTPASLIALLNTVLAITRGIFLLIKSIKNAPEDLISLSSEVQDLCVILGLIPLDFASGGPLMHFLFLCD